MRSERINFLAVVTASAGVLGFLGVFADWFSVSYVVSGTLVVLDFHGTVDGTGAIAAAAALGAFAFGCAYMLLNDPDIRRITALLMVISSVLLLVVSIIGFTRVDEAIGGPDPFLPGAEGQTTYVATWAVGLAMSFVAGILAMTASVLLVARREAGVEETADIPATVSA
jgi:hypothetical protein